MTHNSKLQFQDVKNSLFYILSQAKVTPGSTSLKDYQVTDEKLNKGNIKTFLCPDDVCISQSRDKGEPKPQIISVVTPNGSFDIYQKEANSSVIYFQQTNIDMTQPGTILSEEIIIDEYIGSFDEEANAFNPQKEKALAVLIKHALKCQM